MSRCAALAACAGGRVALRCPRRRRRPARARVDHGRRPAGQVARAAAGLHAQRPPGAAPGGAAAPGRRRRRGARPALARLPGVAGARESTTAFADAEPVVEPGAGRGAGPTSSAASPTGRRADDRRARPRLRPEHRAPAGARRAAPARASRRSRSTRPAGSRGPTPTATAPTTASSWHRRSSTTRPARTVPVRQLPLGCRLPRGDRRDRSRGGPTSSSTPTRSSRGPFDGTGAAARAVDRAAAAGHPLVQLRRQLRAAPLGAARGRTPTPTPPSTGPTATTGPSSAAPARPITFALSWAAPPSGPPTDLDSPWSAWARTAPGPRWRPPPIVRPREPRRRNGSPAMRPPSDGIFRLRVVAGERATAGRTPDPVFPRDTARRHRGLGGGEPADSRRRPRGHRRRRHRLARQHPQVVLQSTGRPRTGGSSPTCRADQHPGDGADRTAGRRRHVERGAERRRRRRSAARRSAPDRDQPQRGGDPLPAPGIALDLGVPGPDPAFGAGPHPREHRPAAPRTHRAPPRSRRCGAVRP